MRKGVARVGGKGKGWWNSIQRVFDDAHHFSTCYRREMFCGLIIDEPHMARPFMLQAMCMSCAQSSSSHVKIPHNNAYMF